MKLSENTTSFLKNYANINQSLEFREGKVLRTVSPLNTILASVEISVNKCNYLWDVLKLIPRTLKEDSMELEPVKDGSFKDVIFSQKENIFVSNSQIMPNVVINAQNGPVIIDENTLIGSLSYLEGPVYIGPKTVISPLTKIKNSVIGPSCKIGGEIESSTIQGFTNKVHDGHLGDSFIGEWVNFGAGTTNSNLNNNYSTVKISFGGAEIDSKILHLGCFVGDHVKTAIGTLIPEATVFGFSQRSANSLFSLISLALSFNFLIPSCL